MNKTNELKNILFVLVLTLAGKIYAASEKIQILQIKVVIDDSEFAWKEEGLELLNETKNPRLLPKTILSFTNLKPGKMVSLKSFERELKETELRILASGLVYSAKVVIVPVRKNPEKRTVLIIVQSGFFPRFGGGEIYGVYGRAGLCGRRMEVLGYGGWNVNGISWMYENAFDCPLILGSSVFWDGPAAFFEEENYSSLNGLMTAGFFAGPDLRICADLNQGYSFEEKIGTEQFSIKPYVKLEKYFSENLVSNFSFQTVFYPLKNEDFFDSWDLVFSTDWQLNRHFIFAASFGAGMGNCSLLCLQILP